MMNIDQARVGEGIVGSKDKKPKMSDDEDASTPALFESDEKPLRLAVPEGWSVKK